MKQAEAAPLGASLVSWICTAVTLAGYFALMLTVAYAPGLLSRPLTAGGTISVGLLVGVAIIGFLIVVSSVYTDRQNRGTPPS